MGKEKYGSTNWWIRSQRYFFVLTLSFSWKVLGPAKWDLENINFIVIHIKFWLGSKYGQGIIQCELNYFDHVYVRKNNIRREMFLAKTR